MPRIVPSIYVAHPDLIKLDGEKVDFEDLEISLASEAENATAITVLGGYFNPDSLVKLCCNVPPKPAYRRRNCRIRIAVGIDRAVGLPQLWNSLREVKAALTDQNFQHVDVRVIRSNPVHFHTKLFGFVKATQPVWFAGSANPGSERHELMVRVNGRHDALAAYAEAAISAGMSVELEPPVADIQDLRTFFLSGMLAHKPPPARLFTFDAFRFTPEQRAALSAAIGEQFDVPHASPKTEGYGFSLASAAGMQSVQAADTGAETGHGLTRIRYRESYVETLLGFWMPRAYARELEANANAEQAARKLRLAGC